MSLASVAAMEGIGLFHRGQWEVAALKSMSPFVRGGPTHSSVFFAVTAHALQTPLRTVRGGSPLIAVKKFQQRVTDCSGLAVARAGEHCQCVLSARTRSPYSCCTADRVVMAATTFGGGGRKNGEERPLDGSHVMSITEPLLSGSVLPSGAASQRQETSGSLEGSRLDCSGSDVKLSVRNLHFTAPNGAKILDDISFEVCRGEIFALLGPNGCGKTTVLRAMNRLWQPPSDSIFLNGQDVTKMTAPALRRRVGMMFQATCLFDGSVADNVRYGPALQGKNLSDDEVVELLNTVGLGAELASRSVAGLSGGQAQGTALARVLANNPQVLLLDEPTSALDPTATRTVEKTILSLRETRGLTVVMVSHNIDQVRRIADRVCFLKAGRVEGICHTKELDDGPDSIQNPWLSKYLGEVELEYGSGL